MRFAILTTSDQGARGEREDVSGGLAEKLLIGAGHTLVARTILPDDRTAIAGQLRAWCDGGDVRLVVTTGGTGLTARDLTPEATRDVAERDVPGIPLLLLTEGLKQTPYAVLSRGIAVLRRETLIVNLPGNPKAVGEGLAVLLPLLGHIEQLLAGPTEHRTDADTGHARSGA